MITTNNQITVGNGKSLRIFQTFFIDTDLPKYKKNKAMFEDMLLNDGFIPRGFEVNHVSVRFRKGLDFTLDDRRPKLKFPQNLSEWLKEKIDSFIPREDPLKFFENVKSAQRY